MKILRNFIAIVFLFVALACTDSGQSSQSCGAAGGNATGDSSNPEGDSTNFASEPIDIPVPVAKGIDSVDATQFSFSVNGADSNIHQSLVSDQQAVLAACGGVSTTIRGKSQQANVTITAYLNGASVCEVTTGADRSFTCEICQNVCGSPVLFIANGSDGTGSYPVTFICDAADSVIPTVHSTHLITNITGIQLVQPAASDNLALYCTRANDGEILMARSPVVGGFPERVNDEDTLTECMTSLGVDDGETFLLGRDSSGDILDVIIANGVTSDTGNNTEGDLRIYPGDAYFASVVTNGGSLVVQNINATDDTTSLVTVNAETQVDDLEIAPTDEDILLVMKQYNDGTNEAQLYDLFGNMGADTVVAPISLFMSACSMRNPQVNPNTGTEFVYECIDGNNNRHLYRSDGVTQTLIVNASESLSDIRNCTWTTDGEFVVCDAIPEEDASTRVIFAYQIDTAETVRLFEGRMPKRVPSYDSVFVYHTNDTTGVDQIGVHNLALDSRF